MEGTPAETRMHALQSASSAELSDIEHTELISQYGSDQYLRRWSLEDQGHPSSTQQDHRAPAKLDVFLPYNAGSTSPVQANYLPAGDCDGTSLLSFNSVHDCPPPSHSARVTQHVTHQSQDSPDFQVWHGYGGNVYFEPMRCNTMTIYSSKPPRLPLRPELKHWNSRSGQPEKHVRQSNMRKLSRDMAVENLGSLRIKTREERLHSGKAKGSSIKLPGKICKGFSKNSLADFTSSSPRYVPHTPKAATMQVTGGQVCDTMSGSIQSVQDCNSGLSNASLNKLTSTSFPTLSATKMPSNEAQGNTTHNVVTGPFVKLPQLDRDGSGKTPTKRQQRVDGGRSVVGVSQVLKIPFGAFDDPVEVESASGELRKKYVEESTKTEGKHAKRPSPKPKEPPQSKAPDRDSVSCKTMPLESHKVCNDNEPSVQGEGKQPDEGHADVRDMLQGGTTGTERKHGDMFQSAQSANLCLKREISNVSLSNYLKAVPSPQLCQTSGKRLAQKFTTKNRPRLSYTQRTRARPGISAQYSVNQATHSSGSKANGYVPCKGKEPKSVDYKGQGRLDGQFHLYVHEVTGEEMWSKPSDTTRKKHGRNARSQYPIVYGKSEKSTRLGQAIFGHHLVRS